MATAPVRMMGPAGSFCQFMADQEEVLAGGNVAAQVVRIGATVRKPVTPATPAVEALLAHLSQVGFDGAPRHYGRDEQGRQVLEYVPGLIAHGRRLTTAELARVAGLIRELHDALESFVGDWRSALGASAFRRSWHLLGSGR
jgi:hypothetical protein